MREEIYLSSILKANCILLGAHLKAIHALTLIIDYYEK